MEKQLKLVLVLSLKEIALRRVAVLLWSGSDILTPISKFENPVFHTDESKKEWRKTVEDKVKDKVYKLELPQSLIKQMIGIVQPIGIEIKRWKESHEDIFFGSIEYIDLPDWSKLYWTTSGTIDSKKTAENLVRSDALNVNHRYEMACFYCLEDDLLHLWEELSAELKYHYQHESYSVVLYMCWPHLLKGELSELDYLWIGYENRNLTSFNQWAFENSVENGRRPAAEYFFHKLTLEEREVSLMRSTNFVLANRVKDYFGEEMFSSVVFYLLFQMTPEQQMETIKAHPIEVSLCFFHLPLQDIFLENASLIWACLPQSGYGDLLRRMADKFRYSSHYYYPKLFQEFFTQSPLDFKIFFVDQKDEFGDTPASRLLDIFLALEDSESIEVLFRNLDVADRVKIVFHRHALGILYDLIALDRWHMAEVCLREAMLSKENLEKLKEALKNFFKELGGGARAFRNLTRFFKRIDEGDTSSDRGKERLEVQV